MFLCKWINLYALALPKTGGVSCVVGSWTESVLFSNIVCFNINKYILYILCMNILHNFQLPRTVAYETRDPLVTGRVCR